MDANMRAGCIDARSMVNRDTEQVDGDMQGDEMQGVRAMRMTMVCMCCWDADGRIAGVGEDRKKA